MEHSIIVVGIGPGSPDYVLPGALRAIRDAHVLVGGARALKDFSREGQKTMTVRGDMAQVMDFIRRSLAYDDVTVMVSGDPGYYSLLDPIRREFGDGVISVIPGIGSVQFAFSRLALPWHGAHLASFHGRMPEDSEISYAPGKVLGMLTDTKHTSRTIPGILMKVGWPEGTRLAICSRLSYDDERIVKTTLAGAADEREETHAVLVVGGEADERIVKTTLAGAADEREETHSVPVVGGED